MSYSSNINIPSDVWRVIGSKLNSLEDRVHFRAVSKSWRSLLPPPPHPPCLMLDHKSVGRHFMCLGKQEMYKLDFPEDHGTRCIGSAGDWLITLHEDQTIRLRNLFSRAQTHLPHSGITRKGDTLSKVVLSSSLWEGPNCSAMAIYDWDHMVAVVRPGDTSWTEVPLLEESRYYIEDITFYKQKFYAVNNGGRLLVCDVGGDVNPPRLSCIAQLGDVHNVNGDDEDEDEVSDDDDEYSDLYVKLCIEDEEFYLVECSGELLAVVKFTEYFNDSDSIHSRRVERVKWIKVYRFDFTSMEFIKLKSLGEHSLFFGWNGSCASVLASDYFGLVRKNCIYFIDSKIDAESDNDAESGIANHNVRVFGLEDKWYYPPHMSTFSHSPPVWIVPTRP